MSNWQASGAGGLYGYNNGGGNSGSLTISARDSLDFARLGSPGRTPQAEYPDGYLGSVNGRRGDKLLEKIGSLNQRSYTRGVHRGERIPPSDYQWTSDWNPQRGIKTQMTGMRQALAAPGPQATLPHNLDSPRPNGPVGNIPLPQMQPMLPPWN